MAVRCAHEKYQQKAAATKELTAFLTLTLTLNNFIFNSKFYLQIKDCGMGSACAPSYPNIFMAYFEEKIIYLPSAGKTSLYVRFIDDMIWILTKAEQELVEFLNNSITKRASIEFKFKYFKEKIEFLDTLLYTKRMTTFRPHFTGNLPIVKINCTQNQNILSTETELRLQKNRLIARGYA